MLKTAKPETKRWKPEYETHFWYVDSTAGDIHRTIWVDTRHDKWRYNQGNCFKTREEAEEYKKYLEAYARIKQSSSFVPDWEDRDQLKWSIYYDHSTDKFKYESYYNYQYPLSVYYATREEAEQAIKDYGDDYLTIMGMKIWD